MTNALYSLIAGIVALELRRFDALKLMLRLEILEWHHARDTRRVVPKLRDRAELAHELLVVCDEDYTPIDRRLSGPQPQNRAARRRARRAAVA